MDIDVPVPLSKRIRSTNQRLGPRDEPNAKADVGHKVCVSNLHPKVTEEDIAASSFPSRSFYCKMRRV